jgi:hypothetical protein
MRRSIFAVVLTGAAAVGAALVEWGVIEAAIAAPRSAGKLNSPIAAKAEATQLAPQFVYLVRSALGALQDANSTGNYSVLRDLAAPSFQAKHSAADLAEIFAAARRKPVDLAPAAFVTPVVSETSRPDATRLHLSGYVPYGGERTTFVLQFEAVGGHWRIAALSIGTIKE